MRRTGRKLFISTVLAVQLATGGVFALPDGSPVIGQIIASSRTSVGAISLPWGGTLLDNDAVRTEKGGQALVDFPEKIRAAVAEETNVRFRNAGGRLVADLDSGTVITLKQELAALTVETPKYTVEPKARGRAIYMVSMLPDRSTMVAAKFGNIVITERASGRQYELREGSYASISASAVGVPAAPQEKEESRPAPEQPSPPATGTPPASAPPPKPPWHIGTMSPGASAALLAAVIGGGLAGAAAAFAGGGGGGTVSPTQ